MIPGTFSFLLCLFSSPQQVITHKFEGHWIVVEDYTSSKRNHWDKVYSFESCDKETAKRLECQGFYGWVDRPGVVINVLDKNYFVYGITKEKDTENGYRKLLLHDEEFYFRLWPNKGKLEIIDIEGMNVVMVMEKFS